MYDLAPKTHKGVCVPVCLNSLSNAVFIIITSQSLETTNISTSVQYYRTFFFKLIDDLKHIALGSLYS